MLDTMDNEDRTVAAALAARHALVDTLRRLSALRFEVIDAFADGEAVLVEWRAQAMLDGLPVEWEGTDRIEPSAAAIVNYRVSLDATALLAAARPRAVREPAA